MEAKDKKVDVDKLKKSIAEKKKAMIDNKLIQKS